MGQHKLNLPNFRHSVLPPTMERARAKTMTDIESPFEEPDAPSRRQGSEILPRALSYGGLPSGPRATRGSPNAILTAGFSPRKTLAEYEHDLRNLESFDDNNPISEELEPGQTMTIESATLATARQRIASLELTKRPDTLAQNSVESLP